MMIQEPQVKEIFSKLEERLAKSIENTKSEYSLLRIGRANSRILDKVMVESYGTMMPINQLGNISTADARTLVVSVWDKTQLSKVEKAILAANIGLTPNNDGSVIRLVFPEVTEEKRKEIVKQVKKLAEDGRVAMRNIRRDAMDGLKKLKNDKVLAEDAFTTYEKEAEKIFTKNIEVLDKTAAEKEKEVLSINNV